MNQIRRQIENLCHKSQNEILIVAPFIKASVLKQLLANINPSIQLQCVTRWLPEDILGGVCDLEIWQVIQTFPNASLWIRSDLHAKYYRFDDYCLVGSANLTAKALGWSNSPNLELLVQLPVNEPYFQNFEQELFTSAIQVTEDWFNSFQELIAKLQQENLTFPLITPQFTIEPSVPPISSEAWLPMLRNPEELYIAYCGDWDNLTRIARQAATNDLSYLHVIPSLSKTAFEAYVGAIILQKPIIQQLDILVKTPQRFGTVCNFLTSLPCSNLPDFNSQRVWQTLMRWLLYFLPHRYAVSVPRHSDIFYRIR